MPTLWGAMAQEEQMKENISNQSLAGIKVLVVEDEALISMMLEDMLSELGCEVVGPVAKLSTALTAITEKTFDAAILDMNLGGESAWPAADLLRINNVPVIFSTGYGQLEGAQDLITLPKPYDAATLRSKLLEALQNQGGRT